MGDDLVQMSRTHLNTSGSGNARKKDSYNRDKMLDQKFSKFWSPQEESKFLLKHKYISCSRSVPRRNKRFLRYRTSRSLNLDVNSHNSTSESSSFEDDKHLSRSAKIMRALNFNNSPSYYGKTKIKRSLNFNVTPSPKTFTRSNGKVRKALSMNLSSSSNDSKAFSNLNKSPPNDSANNSLLFASFDSIDENQNETPSQRNMRGQKLMNYSTPDARVDMRTPGSVNFTPVLRSSFNEMIDNIVHIPGTPFQQSSRCNKSRLKYTDEVAKSTPRNLFRDFHEDNDNDDDRPRTPENLIRVIPESMSAIKRSHKKERTSRWGERGSGESAKISAESIKSASESVTPLKTNPTFGNFVHDCDPMKGSILVDDSWKEMPTCNSEGDLSDTGSIFNYYAEEQKLNLRESLNESIETIDPKQEYSDDFVRFTECEEIQEHKENLNELKLKLDRVGGSFARVREKSESFERLDEVDLNDLLNDKVDIKIELRPVTPELEERASEDASKPVTPDNSINFLQHALRDSIKKSHKKNKDDNRRKLLSPKGLLCKTEITKVKEVESVSRNYNFNEDIEKIDLPNTPSTFRAVTPEKVNSSRMLLSQFSSVKKSHKKDKHNKILSGFLKRQEYFQRDMNFVANTTVSQYRDNADALALDLESSSSIGTGTPERNIGSQEGITAVEKLSPSKRKKPVDAPVERDNVDVLGDYESRRFDTATEEFRIFTPLKRRKSLNASVEKEEYLCAYRLPSGDNDMLDEPLSDIALSRCITPVASFRENYLRLDEIKGDSESGAMGNCVNFIVKAEDEDQGSATRCETCDNDSKDLTGRSTPKNMSPSELHFNIDSIKKSHKKTKRGSCSRKGRTLDGHKTRAVEVNRSSEQRLSEAENFQRDSSERYCFVDHAETSVTNQSNIQIANEKSAISPDRTDVNAEGKATATMSSNKTPPNCLKVKNYIKLLQDTSIKRSHKKVRNRRKQEPIVVPTELSDDGSIFGDEEKLSFVDDCSTTDIVDPDFVNTCTQK